MDEDELSWTSLLSGHWIIQGVSQNSFRLVRHIELKKYILRWCPVNFNEKNVQNYEDPITFDQMMEKE